MYEPAMVSGEHWTATDWYWRYQENWSTWELIILTFWFLGLTPNVTSRLWWEQRSWRGAPRSFKTPNDTRRTVRREHDVWCR